LLDEADFQTLSRTEDYLASNQDPQDGQVGLGRWETRKDPSDR
jgi:hypothetical protein